MADLTLSCALAEIKLRKERFYVYMLVRPDGSIFYVGKGQKRRIYEHERYAKGNSRKRLYSIMRKIWRSGNDVLYRLHAFFDDESSAHAEEARLISLFGKVEEGGLLANVTDGGEGVSGLVHTDESRRRMSESHSSPDLLRLKSDVLREQNKDPSFARAREGARVPAVAAAQRSPENRAAKSLKMKEVLANQPELLDSRRKQLQEVRPSSEVSSDITKKSWIDPVVRARRVRGLKAAANKPELLELRRERATKRWSDPEARARVSAAVKATLAAKKAALASAS
ncbi:putative homing endonuclease protein [Rhizobium phage RHph_X2_25]|nr:putative homing endonuclease protein [Rhizobium phage RHph_X2_25]